MRLLQAAYIARMPNTKTKTQRAQRTQTLTTTQRDHSLLRQRYMDARNEYRTFLTQELAWIGNDDTVTTGIQTRSTQRRQSTQMQGAQRELTGLPLRVMDAFRRHPGQWPVAFIAKTIGVKPEIVRQACYRLQKRGYLANKSGVFSTINRPTAYIGSNSLSEQHA